MNRSGLLLPSAHPARDCVKYGLTGLATMGRTAARKFQRLASFDFGIKYGDHRVEVGPIERGIGGTKV
jgi:hypothetical protein